MGICVLRGHCMKSKHGINSFKVLCHIGERFTTRWTLIRCLNIFLMTFVMNTMSTRLNRKILENWFNQSCQKGQPIKRKERKQITAHKMSIHHYSCKRKAKEAKILYLTIKMTVVVEVNMYSPQIGQSDSRFRSIHLWFPFKLMAIHTLHFLQ